MSGSPCGSMWIDSVTPFCTCCGTCVIYEYRSSKLPHGQVCLLPPTKRLQFLALSITLLLGSGSNSLLNSKVCCTNVFSGSTVVSYVQSYSIFEMMGARYNLTSGSGVDGAVLASSVA